jgi:hypothetical protein
MTGTRAADSEHVLRHFGIGCKLCVAGTKDSGAKEWHPPASVHKARALGQGDPPGPLYWFSKDGGIATSPGTCLSGVGAPPSSMKSPYTGAPGLLCVVLSLALPRSAGGCYDLAPSGSIRAHPAGQAVRSEVHTRRGRAGRDPCEFNRGCSRMVSREKAGHQVRELTDFQGIPEK